MAAPIVPHAVQFTREDLNAAASAAQRKVGNDKAWQGAIARALVNLASGQFSFDGQQVLLHSASSDTIYRISTTEPMTCTCKGRGRGYKCWHIVAARLIVRAAEHYQERQRALCPMCGAAIEGRQYYVGGRGYTYFEVCSGDGSHYARAA